MYSIYQVAHFNFTQVQLYTYHLFIFQILLREWLQDNTFTGSFRFLGSCSLLYTAYNFFLKLFRLDRDIDRTETGVNTSHSMKGCLLCGCNLVVAASTLCGHIFCWKCIYDSLAYRKSCPICREPVTHSRIIFLQNFV